MSAPRRCDMNQAQMLGRYLQQHPSLVRVTALDPGASGLLVAGSPGWVWSLRGISRACREALFVHELATLDFGLEVEIPRIWSDSSTGITAAKRIGPGTKLKHLDVSEFYVQGATQAGKALLRKVKGTENPANFLTKHAKTGNEVAQALPSLAMVDPTLVAGASAAERHSVKLVRENPPSQWKPVLPFKPTVDRAVQQNAATAKEELPEEPGGEEVPEEVATPPVAVAVEDLFRAPARAAPPRDPRPPAPEPEPHDGDAGAAAEAAAPPPPAAPQVTGVVRARRRRLQPGARLPPMPQHQFGELYYAPTRRTVHLHRNCVGLASVPQNRITTENLCFTCWGGMIIGHRWEDLTHFLVVGDDYTPHVFRQCTEIRGWARQLPVCNHCRGHHFVRDG
ncbi:unnamed protein product [Symbiodinium sp. CCMP2592]|nr:unnamed protein product [Symbiodinium sp. CCMP2592]